MHSSIFKNTKPFVKLLVLFGMSLALLLVASGVQTVLLLSGGGMEDPDMLRWSQLISQLLMFALPVVLLILFFEDDGKGFLKADFRGRSWYRALVGVVMLVLLLPAIDVVTEWNEGWHFGDGVGGTIEEMLRKVSDQSKRVIELFLMQEGVGNLFFNLVVVALVPAVCEELFFRCGVQQTLQEWFGNRHWAVVVAAVIFSLAHFDVFGFVPRVLLGLLLGYLYVYSGSMVVNMSVHFVNNALIVVLYYLNTIGVTSIDPEDLPSIGWVWTAVCAVAAIFLFYVTFLHKGTGCEREGR